MVSLVRSVYLLSRMMPWVLRRMCLSGLAGGPFVVVSLFLPFMKFYIDDQQVTWVEFWRTGAALIFIVLGFYLALMGLGILLRRPYGRFMALGFIVLPTAFMMVQPQEEGMAFVRLFAALPALAMTWYLFFKPSVEAYFNLPKLTIRDVLTPTSDTVGR